MEFKVGDRVRRLGIHQDGNFKTYCRNENVDVGGIFTVIQINTEYTPQGLVLDKVSSSWCSRYFELVSDNSILKEKKMEKKIIRVLAVNKKTSKTEKNETVVADNEQHAILKAFGVDVENLYIKTQEEGSFVEDKPVSAVIVKDDKKN